MSLKVETKSLAVENIVNEESHSTVSVAKKFSQRKKIILIIACVLIFAFVIVPSTAAVVVYNLGVATRVDSPTLSRYLRYGDVEGYPRRLVNFSSGRNSLQAYIYGEDNDMGLIVMSHAISWGSEDYFPQVMYFVDMGWRVFAFDNTGTHGSEGRNTRGLPQSVFDLDAALTYIVSEDWGLPIMLYGHSWGGYSVTAVLDRGHNVNAVVSLAGFAIPMEVMHEVARDFVGLGFFATMSYPHLWVYHRLCFGRDANISAIDGINSGEIPIMIIHGTEDDFISHDGASIISHRNRITNPNVEFISGDSPHRNGHSNLWRSEDAVIFEFEVDETLSDMARVHGGTIPDDVRAEYYAEIRSRLSSLDIELMDEINDFFRRQL
jgi:pimeloyl-ACP methyl ester carboxylesterase